jgi:hypothetical protein
MDQNSVAPNDVIGLAGALLKLLCREYPDDLRGFVNGPLFESARLAAVNDSGNSAFTQTESVGWNPHSHQNWPD